MFKKCYEITNLSRTISTDDFRHLFPSVIGKKKTDQILHISRNLSKTHIYDRPTDKHINTCNGCGLLKINHENVFTQCNYIHVCF